MAPRNNLERMPARRRERLTWGQKVQRLGALALLSLSAAACADTPNTTYPPPIVFNTPTPTDTGPTPTPIQFQTVGPDVTPTAVPMDTPAATDTPTGAPAPTETPTPGTTLTTDRSEVEEFGANVFTTYQNASGQELFIPMGETVTAACLIYDPTTPVTSTHGLWYRLDNPEGMGGATLYAPANTFWNQTPAQLPDENLTYDPELAVCTDSPSQTPPPPTLGR